MFIYKSLNIKERIFDRPIEVVVTLGVFDGFHLGHQFILKKLKDYAQRNKLRSLLLTFALPPELILGKDFTGFIMDKKDKIEFLKSQDIDYVWIFKINQALLKLPAGEFLLRILRHFKIVIFIVGQDFRFGVDAHSDIFNLRKLSKAYNFRLVVIKKIKLEKKIISSSLIRQLIRRADFKKARLFLGRDYVLKGRVCKGRGLGKALGFPTANIETPGYVLPERGVYAAKVFWRGKEYLAGVNIGRCPTLGLTEKNNVEVHLVNFSQDILGKKLSIVFLEKIREEKRFPSPEALREAIEKDLEYLKRKYL